FLLKASNFQGGGNTDHDFSREVFRFAGPRMLPLLHQSLQSDQRIIRANAAAACGAIGDPASLDPLIKALEMESGLARDAIVLDLAQLKAQKALPLMTQLYIDARADEARHQGSGFRAQQAKESVASQYQHIGSIASISGDLDELKMSAIAPPIDPIK